MADSNDIFPAHFKYNSDGSLIEQSVGEHLHGTADRNEVILSPLGFPNIGRLIGMIHDGKLSEAFRTMLRSAERGEPVRKGSVIHTFFGCRWALSKAYGSNDPYKILTAELIAFAVGSHHGQFDIISPDGKDGFIHRLESDAYYSEIIGNYHEIVMPEAELYRLFESSVEEVRGAVGRIGSVKELVKNKEFTLGMLARIILSSLIEADRSDTAGFMLGRATAKEIPDLSSTFSERLAYLEEKLTGLDSDSEINRARRYISEKCAEFSEKSGGIWRLQVPTGGGKTISSLRAALSFAKKHHSSRIIFAVPLLSVLEQNAKVIREFVGDDSLIVEHHSNVVRESSENGELDMNELIIENWHSPIIITTLVQLLNTLFEGRTSSIRRLHALINSVIVIDEVQSLPRRMIYMFNLAMNFLAYFCGCTVILCSATNPCFESIKDYPMKILGDIVPQSDALSEIFRRTRLTCLDAPMEPPEIAGFASEKADELGSVLIICNKKNEAAELFGLLRNSPDRVYHLSTSLCMAHRKEVFAAIERDLKSKQRVICVSTQLAEAGMDLSFGCAIRIFAGLDNAIQTAGRCNRSGEYGDIREVFIIKWKGEELNRLGDIKQSKDAFEKLLISPFSADLQSPDAIKFFYNRLFMASKEGEYSYPIKNGQNLLDYLSVNKQLCAKYKSRHLINQSFKTAGDIFCVFDDNTTDIIVPYRGGKELIADLASERAEHDLAYRGKLIESCKPYTVSLFEWQLKKIAGEGGVIRLCNGAVFALGDGFYDELLGVVSEKGDMDFLNA